MSRCVLSSTALVFNTKPLVGALAAALLACSTSYAAGFGHSRIVSALGQPLRIDVPITQLSSDDRSEEHTSELQSLMRISYAVFCLKKKTTKHNYIYCQP